MHSKSVRLGGDRGQTGGNGTSDTRFLVRMAREGSSPAAAAGDWDLHGMAFLGGGAQEDADSPALRCAGDSTWPWWRPPRWWERAPGATCRAELAPEPHSTGRGGTTPITPMLSRMRHGRTFLRTDPRLPWLTGFPNSHLEESHPCTRPVCHTANDAALEEGGHELLSAQPCAK